MNNQAGFVLRLFVGPIVRVMLCFTCEHFCQRRNLDYLEIGSKFFDVENSCFPFWAADELVAFCGLEQVKKGIIRISCRRQQGL